MESDVGEGEGGCWALPEGCIAEVLSLTGPRDACRLSAVSSTFRSAADSDAVWERFLPPDYRSILSRSAGGSSLLASSSSSKKRLYFSICDNPILLDDGKKICRSG
uniref:F-box protein PP2-B10-like n=1 Tax=Rhizophora mucronata TaxID=61149 RepID=A0A2P2M949_RHIMU